MEERNVTPVNEPEVDYTNVEEARAFFIKDRYAMVTSGMDIVAVDKDYAKCCMPIDERHLNAMNSVMGGAMFTLADFAFAVATNFKRPGTVTVVSQISYLSASKGKMLYAETRKIKDGRKNCFFEIMITDDLGRQVAVVSTTGSHVGA